MKPFYEAHTFPVDLITAIGFCCLIQANPITIRTTEEKVSDARMLFARSSFRRWITNSSVWLSDNSFIFL